MDMQKLMQPYAKTHNLSHLRIWLKGEAAKLCVPQEAVELSFMEIFQEMEAGRKFAKDGGDTGFTGVAHAELGHHLKERLIKIGAEMGATQSDEMERSINAVLEARERAEEKAANPSVFIRIKNYYAANSVVVRMATKLWRKLNGS